MMVETQPNPMVEKREYRMHHDVPVLLAQPCSELPGNLHSHRRSRTDGKRKVKAAGMPHSKSPSIFDHRVRNPSTIESNYQKNDVTVLYADASQIAPYATQSVVEANTLGLMKGFPDNHFAPQRSFTREEAAIVIMKLMELT